MSRRVRTLLLPVLAALLLGGCGATDDRALADGALADAVAAHRNGDLGSAARGYHETLQHDPTNVYAFYGLALVASGEGDTSRAEHLYVVALGQDPTYVPALMNLGLILTETGRVEEAIARYRDAATYAPNLAAVHFRLGVLLGGLGRDEEAATSLSTAKTLDLTIDETRAFIPSGPLAEGSAVTPAPFSSASPAP